MVTTVDYWRQLDMLPPKRAEAFPVTVIGCGGIGSPTTLCLAKMGITRLTLVDPDVVDTHNLPNQLFPLDALGERKVTALAAVIRAFAGVDPVVQSRYWMARDRAEGILVCAVDSMEQRKLIWNSAFHSTRLRLFVDGRMGAETGLVYAVDMLHREAVDGYARTLYSDEEAIALPCTARAIIYNVFGIAALIAHAVKEHLNDKSVPYEQVLDLATGTLIRSQPPIPRYHEEGEENENNTPS